MADPDPNVAPAAPSSGTYNLPTGISSVEQLIESYGHAQRKITEQGQELGRLRTPAPQSAPQPQAPPQVPGLGIHQQAPQDMTSSEYIAQFAHEFNTAGKLSDQTYARIQQEKGWDRHLVDGWIQGQLSRQREIQSTGFQAVGGEQNYQALAAWIQNSWGPEQIEAYNSAVTSGNPHLAQMAVQGAWTQYQQAEGGGMNLLQGQGSGTQGLNPAEGFRDEDEWMAAMEGENYEKYDNDPAYRRSVIRKLAMSPWAYQNPRHREVDRKTFLEGALDGLPLPR